MTDDLNLVIRADGSPSLVPAAKPAPAKAEDRHPLPLAVRRELMKTNAAASCCSARSAAGRSRRQPHPTHVHDRRSDLCRPASPKPM